MNDRGRPHVPPGDAHVLARLRAGMRLNGEVERLGEAFRSFGRRLNEAPTEDRDGLWGSFLSILPRDESEALLAAVARADPSAPPPDGEPARAAYKLVRAADVACKDVHWAWGGRIPRGMLSLLAGDPKLGKSFVTLAVAAAISAGVALPGDDPPDGPGSVVLLSAEDDPARTIVPRLKAAGADLARVHLLESVFLADGSEALPSLRADVDAIEAAVEGLSDCRLVVVDPVSAYLGGADDHRNSELRGVLSPLKKVAERTDAAIVLVSHLNKGGGTNGKHRVAGSIAYVGAARANFLFVKDWDDPSGRRVLMLDNGCTLVEEVPTLAYRIEDRGDGPAVEWEAEPVDITAEQALSAEKEEQAERGERDACDRWLRDVLAAGPVLQVDVMAAGRDAGFSPSAVNRSKRRVGARSTRDGFGKGSKCSWSLAGNACVDEASLPIDFA